VVRHSRFCVSAMVVARATAKPVCDALAAAMREHGVPEAILTDNGKVFSGRFGTGTGEVLFDRICRENGIRHLLTAPHSPTTTGKVERFHKTLKREFLDGKSFESIADAQAELDMWVQHYNHERPHQSVGDRAPIERFRLAKRETSRPLMSSPNTTSLINRSLPPYAARVASLRAAGSASPGTAITLAAGSPARPSRSSASTDWCN
jgi:transposase InsO family protein